MQTLAARLQQSKARLRGSRCHKQVLVSCRIGARRFHDNCDSMGNLRGDCHDRHREDSALRRGGEGYTDLHSSDGSFHKHGNDDSSHDN